MRSDGSRKWRLQPLPVVPFRAVLRLERRITHDGLVSVGGNFYSVPEARDRGQEPREAEAAALAGQAGLAR
ncbi:hypothetical protein [Methylobacterium sp. 1030]|uniref:Mu transposase domain-containing protein n=1 Tax=Methylobacterium sp. 1030 TaxID=3156404 RepID=UPI0033917CAC